jgi:hypothetical protein
MKMKTKKSAKETLSVKHFEHPHVPVPKTRGQVKVAMETTSTVETVAAVGKRRPGRPSKKLKSSDL